MEIHLEDDTPGLTDVPGFEVEGVACDIRQNGQNQLDLAVAFSQLPCSAAGVFTRNDLKAAPVRLDQEYLQSNEVFHGFIANSGNANAATGETGMTDARQMGAHGARLCHVNEGAILVCSTGRIGRPLPMENIERGMSEATRNLGSASDHGHRAAQAILTSDTRPKTVTARFNWEDHEITLAGMAKGAGMIQPDMATMLAFLATDADIPTPLLRELLSEANATTFNRISIDGDTSTNDTVLLLANATSGITIDGTDQKLRDTFAEALRLICANLARKIVQDGERVTKCVDLRVEGAKSEADAEKCARAIANSLLVKTSWFGNDPNWGRIAHAAGYAGVGLIENRLDISYDETPVLRGGQAREEHAEEWARIVAQDTFTITLNLNLGAARFSLLSADLTEGYVNFNKSE